MCYDKQIREQYCRLSAKIENEFKLIIKQTHNLKLSNNIF